MYVSPRFLAVSVTTLGFSLALSAGCEPRKKAQSPTPATTVAAAPTTAAPTTTTPGTVAPTATAAPTGTPAPTATTQPTAAAPGAWPTALPGFDPNTVSEWTKKAQEMGLPIPGAVPGAPVAGDPIEAAIKAQAAKHAVGFQPAGPIARTTLKTGEHGGMNYAMQQGKCYVVLGAGGAGVTQMALHMMVPATPPNAVVASDNAGGTTPVLGGGGKPLCPPLPSQVRVDAVATAGSGPVGVQIYVK